MPPFSQPSETQALDRIFQCFSFLKQIYFLGTGLLLECLTLDARALFVNNLCIQAKFLPVYNLPTRDFDAAQNIYQLLLVVGCFGPQVCICNTNVLVTGARNFCWCADGVLLPGVCCTYAWSMLYLCLVYGVLMPVW